MGDEWKTPNEQATDIKKDEKVDGKYPEYLGKYDSSVNFPSKFDSTKLSYVYKFIDPSGEIFSIYGFTTFNRKMEAIPVGSMVKFSYAGMGKTKKDKPVHLCTVQYKTVQTQVSNTDAGEENDDLPF